jgi:hypothetical protein
VVSSPAVAGLLGDVLAGRVGMRSLRTAPVPAAQNPRGVDVTQLDPAEVLLVFGQIAPRAVSAPGSGLSFRVVSSFSKDQLAGTGLTNTELAYRAIGKILAGGGNVVSVATSGGAPGAPTVLAVSDRSLTTGAEQTKDDFGNVQTKVDDQPIAGVDVTATLGTDALRLLAAVPATTTTAPATPGSSAPAATSSPIVSAVPSSVPTSSAASSVPSAPTDSSVPTTTGRRRRG